MRSRIAAVLRFSLSSHPHRLPHFNHSTLSINSFASKAAPSFRSTTLNANPPAFIRQWGTSFPLAGSLLARRFQTSSLSSLYKFPFSRARTFKLLGNSSSRSFFSYGAPPSDIVLWSIIGGNVFVHLMWQTLDTHFMRKHFLVSIDSVLNGRLYTLLTAGFSQRDGYHLFSNMLGLYFFGSEIGMHFGGKYLLLLYLAGCIGGSLGHLAYYAYVYPWIQNIPRKFYNPRYTPAALGASGAITAITIFDILLSPKRTIYFQLLFPMPAALVGVVIIGNDLWQAKQGSSEISAAGHLGGAVVGLLAWTKLMLPWWR